MKFSKDKFVSLIKQLTGGQSWISFLFYIIIVYLGVSYIFLPALYHFTSINYISAVVSGSMDHSAPDIQYTYNFWLQQRGFNYTSWPYPNGVSIGSLVIAYKTPASQINIGDVIVYDIKYQGITEEVIHRVINRTEINGTYYFTTKGDANPASLPFEINIPYSDITGKVQTVVPYLGYPRYLLYLLYSLI